MIFYFIFIYLFIYREVGGEGQDGYLIDQRPKELHPSMPIINVVSVPKNDKKIDK